ncbi:formate/nitrite transporter family protein [Cellulomonas fengjieae]|uniref:Formate/nitrite transporter family protein n=1 Tax=Cellulomonas fengjieae TaxID=2819978 RepID=A0ABS3SCD3_9CELL|nr:formate/nitrite transporter family protein [Cellulomonas fengjieae]MBO3083409.1 formate/nitrite transporter family protein [Cellulomonas fengjieae]QVI65253.1 formate/nitrite transporter family protein [Cellulomonas fengjieae]
MLSISDAVDAQAAAARHKVDLLATPGLLLVRTMLGGAYIGIGVLIMATAGGPLVVAGSPFAPLVQGLVFGVALTVVLVAGAELATSAMMILTQGALRGTVGWSRAGLTLLACMAGNLVGAMLFAFLVHVSGVLAPGTAGGTVLAGMVEHKAHETSLQLLVRGILCNLLVCLAVWSAARLRSEGARIAVVFGCVMVFITSGFEHVVANMTTFSLGLYGGLPGADLAEMARNIALVGLGNLIGGAILVGAAYAYGSGGRPGTGPVGQPDGADAAALTGDREPLAIP